MASLHSPASPPPRSDKRRGRKPADRAEAARGAYAYAGSIADLPKAVDAGVLSERIRAVVFPATEAAEQAFRTSVRFRRIRQDGTLSLETRPKAPSRAKQRIVEGHEARVGAQAYEPDVRAKAILRGRRYAEDDLKAAGGTYGLEEVRALLNDISRQAIDRRVNEGTLLAVPGPGGGRRFPTIQFDDFGAVVPGLKVVTKALGVSSPWAVLNFLVNENERLAGRRPIDALSEGDIDAVVAAASGLGVQGA